MPERRATSRATRFGASACSDCREAGYKRGIVVSPGPLPIRSAMCRATSSGSSTERRKNGLREHRALRKALGLDEAGVDRVHADAAPAQRRRRRARERELRVLRRRVRPARRKGDRARDRDDVDDVRRARGLERRAGTRAGTRRRRGSSFASTCSIRSGSPSRKSARAGDAGVVDEQLHLRMTRRARAPRRASTAARSETSQTSYSPPTSSASARSRSSRRASSTHSQPRAASSRASAAPMPLDAPVTDRYLHTRTLRRAVAVRPRASRTVARNTCLPLPRA